MPLQADCIQPDWPAPRRVKSLFTTRAGGVSQGLHGSLNFGTRVGDSMDAVAQNRERLRAVLPADPHWLHQVHGVAVVAADDAAPDAVADAAYTRSAQVVCAIQVADCLPVLLCDRDAEIVAAAHAGWRGLSGGVLENTITALAIEPDRLLAWLGPAIGPEAFEVGQDVVDAFIADDRDAHRAFKPLRPGKWLADLYALARRRLIRAGVTSIFGGNFCTFSDGDRFFSHRRDRVTGRHAALVWLAD